MSAPAGRTESIATADGARYDAYIAGESGTARPALLIFTPIFGVDGDMTAIADQWAAEGYLVAVPDYFFRVAPGVLDRSEEGRKKGFARWEKLDVDRAIEDMRPLLARLLASPACNGRIGAIGFCAGGELAFLAATRLGAGAAAAFHGTRIHSHLAEAHRICGRLSLHYGGTDPLVPMTEVTQIRAAFKGNPAVDVQVYEGAAHGFSFAGRPSYHEGAATASRARAAEVLAGLKA